MSVIIKTHNLTRRFGELTAVDNLNLEVYSGEIFGLVGPDGAGKTTTLRLLCGLLDPTEGEAWINDHHVEKETEKVKDRIGYMAQRFGLYTDLTVDENMFFYADLFGIPDAERKERMSSLLKMTRMEPFIKRRAGQLSGGMKQKLALMCTLLHRPKILFLDEPTTGVDPLSRRDFWVILHQLVKEGVTIFITTAYMDEAERCNRVGFMRQGKMIHCNPPDVMKKKIEEFCYEIQCPDRRAAKEFLQSQPGVLSVEPFGSALHLFLSPAVTSALTLEGAMNKKGLGHAVFKPIEPSLEDVFIAMARKEQKPD
ncbi:MAG: ABC transporter ATP-binding protein [Nitrospinae bacterium]|nr:ABC transporter ATP-binding protein [Nitrospinota bacterium]